MFDIARWVRRAIAAGSALMVVTAMTSPSLAFEKTINKPTIANTGFGVGVVRLDWCWKHQQMCGKRAADLYCKAQGFQAVSSFEKDPGLPVTLSMGDKKLCNQGICDGFTSITCTKP